MTATSSFGSGPFERFLRWLSPDHNLALSKYEEIRSTITKYFVRRGCLDPEELFAETRDRVIQIINGGGDYPNPDALFYGVARRVWLEDRRKVKSEPINYEPPAPAPEPYKELQSDCLDTCLAKLLDPDRELFTRYFQDTGHDKIEARKRLATEQGGENILRIRIFRIRARLRICMDTCVDQGRIN